MSPVHGSKNYSIIMKQCLPFLVLVLCLLGEKAGAQDPSFSQFYAHRIYLNPALTGLDPGLSVSAISRMQWLRADRGFRTYGAAIELQEPYLRSGFGLSFMHNAEGIGNLATTDIGFNYAYTIPGEKNNVHFGFATRWVQKSLDWSRFIFSDQLDPVMGNVHNSAATPGLERISFFDIDFGVVWRFDHRFALSRGTGRDSRTMIGLSVHHLPGLFGSPQVKESFQNLETVVPPRITFHMGTIIPTMILRGTGKALSISPNFKFDIQGENPVNFGQSLKVFTLGAYLLYEGFYLGALYQDRMPFPSGIKHTNSFILALGGYMGGNRPGRQEEQRFFLGFSVDINTTGLGVAGGNAYELALRYNFGGDVSLFGNRRSRSTNSFLDCKSFF